MKIEYHNLDGLGTKKTRVYELLSMSEKDYWTSVTDVWCPCCNKETYEDGGIIRWAEAGYVSGYRICDGCGRHFMAAGTAKTPKLLRVGTRRSKASKVTSAVN